MNLKLYLVGIIFGILSVFIVFLCYLTRDASRFRKNTISQTTSISMPQISPSAISSIEKEEILLFSGGQGGSSGKSYTDEVKYSTHSRK